MRSFRLCTVVFLAVSYVLMYVAIVRFFDHINILNGALMVGAWLATTGLCYLADRVYKEEEE